MQQRAAPEHHLPALPRPLQATTNALLSHFFSLMTSLWLLRVIANRPSAASVMAKGSKPVAA